MKMAAVKWQCTMVMEDRRVQNVIGDGCTDDGAV